MTSQPSKCPKKGRHVHYSIHDPPPTIPDPPPTTPVLTMNHARGIQSIWNHVFWADEKLLDALTSGDAVPEAATREYAHIIGAEEVWLARLERRDPILEVWPSLSPSDLASVVSRTHACWGSYLHAIDETAFRKSVPYTNSAGRHFENTVEDILIHVALHGQYHRGKVNQMLRQSGLAPVPVDYIAFVRGAAAATEADARRRRP